MKDEVRRAKWHTFLDFLVMPQAHAKHSEISLVPMSEPRRMRLAMISWNAFRVC
jgi:hypothetical protein